VKGREYLVSRRPLKFNVQAVAGTALPKRPVQPEAAVAKTWAVEPRKMGSDRPFLAPPRVLPQEISR
jgi:hypothetical protein